jgi:hypothetical protein
MPEKAIEPFGSKARVRHVGTKLNDKEVRELHELAKRRDQKPSELIRRAILDTMCRESGEQLVSRELVELIFDGILAQVKQHKHRLATETLAKFEKAS